MPVRSPRGRSAAYRGLWEWPLRSPARLALTLVAVVVLAVGVSLGAAAAGGGGGGPGGIGLVPLASPEPTAGATSRIRGTAAPAPPTTLPPVPELTPTTLPLSQVPVEAVAVSARWAAAWVRPAEGVTAQQWLDGLRATTTEEYLGVLATVDPTNIPSTRVTGEPRAVRVSPRSAQLEVPTDAVTLIVLVVDTGSGWRVSDYDRV